MPIRLLNVAKQNKKTALGRAVFCADLDRLLWLHVSF